MSSVPRDVRSGVCVVALLCISISTGASTPSPVANVTYGYKNGQQISPEVAEMLDGMINVASLAAGASVQSSSPENAYPTCIPPEGWTAALGTQQGWGASGGYSGWCAKQWCGAYGCNMLNGVYNMEQSNTWQAHFPDGSPGMKEVSLQVKFKKAYVPEYVSISYLHPPEDSAYTVQFIHEGGQTSPKLQFQTGNDNFTISKSFQIAKVPEALKTNATGAIFWFTGKNRPWPMTTHPLATLISFDVWANATQPVVQFWNPIVPMQDKNGNGTRWHQFLCNYMHGTWNEDMHFSMAPDFHGSEVSSIPAYPQTCIGNVVGGWIGYKSLTHPLCANNYAGVKNPQFPHCESLQTSHRPLVPIADGGCVEEDRACDRGKCKDADRATYSDVHCLPPNGSPPGHHRRFCFIKAQCKMVKKTSCKFCSTVPRATATALDKTITCPQEGQLQQCQVSKTCKCEYKDPEDSNKLKPCDEGPDGKWRLTGLVGLCKTRCGMF